MLILQVRKWRLGKAKQVTQGRRANGWQTARISTALGSNPLSGIDYLH